MWLVVISSTRYANIRSNTSPGVVTSPKKVFRRDGLERIHPAEGLFGILALVCCLGLVRAGGAVGAPFAPTLAPLFAALAPLRRAASFAGYPASSEVALQAPPLLRPRVDQESSGPAAAKLHSGAIEAGRSRKP